MKLKLLDNIEYTILLVLLCLLFFLIGFTIQKWPYFEVDKNMSITNAFGLILTLIIAFLIPYFVKYVIEGGNKKNDVVIKEIDIFRSQLESTNSKYWEIKNSGILTLEDKDELKVYCENLESKLENVILLVENRCNSNTNTYIQEIKKSYIQYWRVLTGKQVNKKSATKITQYQLDKANYICQNITHNLLKLTLYLSNY